MRLFSERNYNLLRQLVITDFKLRYQSSVLGYLWSLAKPLMLFGVLYVVFTQFFRFGDDVPYFPVYLLLGIVLWTYFVEATTAGMRSIVDRGDLIRKVSMPKYIVVLSTSASAFVNLILNLGVVAVFMVFMKVPITGTILYLPIILLELVIIATAASFLLSALFVKFKDIAYIWEVALQILFYATPIIYPLTFVPENYAKIIALSPLAQIIQDAREFAITPVTIQSSEALPYFVGLLVPPIIVLILAVIGSVYFRKNSRTFAEDL